MLGRSDRFGRLRVYTPVTAGEQPIYVHAKIMIVDDRLLRVGSSNLNNRSMGYDAECDLALEADDDTHVTHVIRRLSDAGCWPSISARRRSRSPRSWPSGGR